MDSGKCINIDDYEVIYQEIAKRGPILKLLDILFKLGLPPPSLNNKRKVGEYLSTPPSSPKRGKFDKFCDWYENTDNEEEC